VSLSVTWTNLLSKLLMTGCVFCANDYGKIWCFVHRQTIVVVLCKR
jgi:hypothetical protein